MVAIEVRHCPPGRSSPDFLGERDVLALDSVHAGNDRILALDLNSGDFGLPFFAALRLFALEKAHKGISFLVKVEDGVLGFPRGAYRDRERGKFMESYE